MTTGRKIGLGFGALLVAFLLAAAWIFGPALFPPKGIDVGIAVGEQAPMEIGLRNAQGQQTSLAEMAGPKGTVLLMVRSVDWCPFCMAQLIETDEIAEDVAERGFSLIGLSYDDPASLARFSADEGISYSLVSDKQSEFIDAAGLRDPQYANDPEANGVPYASVLVLAPDGTVLSKIVSEDYRQRPSNDYVLEMIDEALQ